MQTCEISFCNGIGNNIKNDRQKSEILKEDRVSGKISMGHARALLGLENPKNMEALRKEIVKKGLSVRQTENKAKKLKNDSAEKSNSSTAPKDIFIKDLEKDLARRLGTKVEISPKKNGGKLVVVYYSDEDLERIQQLMGSNKK